MIGVGNTMSERDELNKDDALKLVGSFIPTNKKTTASCRISFYRKRSNCKSGK